jgi:DNA-binding transcriptional ArsR family regulator
MMIFTSSARVGVLRVFMLDPTREYYQRQIEAATGLPIRAVQRELERLTSAGLLYRRVEGNRTYYQVDTQFHLFPELQSMVLKTVSPEERLRGTLAVDDTVRLLFHCENEPRVLVVTSGVRRPNLQVDPFTFDVMTMEEFLRAVAERSPALEPFLVRGVDLFGRREDVVWRRIEAAGYSVGKGRGVP